MRPLLLLTVLLAILPTLTGCSHSPAAAASPSRVLWNEEDAAQQLATLKAANDSRFAAIEHRLDALEAPEVDRPDPTFPAPAAATSARPECITIHGIDWDLAALLKTWTKAETDWTWPGQDEPQPLATLRRHLAEPEHALSGIESVPDALLPEIHEALHEMELAQTQQTKPATPPPAPTKAVSITARPSINLGTASTCPNGQCPLQARPAVHVATENRPSIVPNGSSTVNRSTTPTRPGLFRVLTSPVRWVTAGSRRQSTRAARRCR